MPNNHLASITSKPLFIKVAESIVILAPMSHVGCRRASAAVTWANRSAVKLRKGPPEQVSNSFSTSFMRSEEHTSELQSRQYLVCRLLLEKKKNNTCSSVCTPLER